MAANKRIYLNNWKKLWPIFPSIENSFIDFVHFPDILAYLLVEVATAAIAATATPTSMIPLNKDPQLIYVNAKDKAVKVVTKIANPTAAPIYPGILIYTPWSNLIHTFLLFIGFIAI